MSDIHHTHRTQSPLRQVLMVSSSRPSGRGSPIDNQRGQAMLETIIVFPLLLVVLLSFAQLAELSVAYFATSWAARSSARAAAVHLGGSAAAESMADIAALRILAPMLPATPIEPTGDMPPVVRWTTRATIYRSLDGTTVGNLITGGTPVTTAVELVFKDGVSTVSAGLKRLAKDPHTPATVTARVYFDYRLRIPIANRLFGVRRSDGRYVRRISAVRKFPAMYAPTGKERS